MSSAFRDAYVRYVTQFPTLVSLGDGAPPAAWQAELARIQPDAFDAISARAFSVEGGNMSGVGNFEAMHLVRALYQRRADLDVTFVNPYTIAAPEPGVRIGSVVRLQGGC